MNSVLSNVLIVIAVFVTAYAVGHFQAVQKARRLNFEEPKLLDYTAHRALWAYGMPQTKGLWYWLTFILVIVLVEGLTKRLPFGIAIAVAVAIGFLVRPLFRRIGRSSRN